MDEIRKLKGQAERNIYLVGGKALFKDVRQRHALQLTATRQFRSGEIALTYGVQA